MSTESAAGELGRSKSLSLHGVIAQSLGFMGPIFSAAFLLPSVAGLGASGKGAGIASPLALLIATFGIGGVAWIASRYARRIHHAGAIYEYVNDGWGRKPGFVAGWVYYGGMTALTIAIFPAFGGFLHGTLDARLGLNIHWLILTLIALVVAFAMVVYGIEISVRVQLAIAVISIGVLFAWSVYVIFKGGPAGNSIKAFSPGEAGGSGLMFGLVYACLAFTGFETAANLAEETAHPGRSIPIAMLASVGLIGIFYVALMYAMVSAFGFEQGTFVSFDVFPQLLVSTGSPDVGGTFFGKLVEWIVVIDIFAVALGCGTSCARGIFAMARDGHLSKWLAATHGTRKTPMNAALALGGVTGVVAIWAHLADGIVAGAPAEAGGDPGPWFRIFQWGAAWGALGLILVYLLVALSGFKPQAGENQVGMIVAALLGTGATVAAVFGTIYKAPSFFALNKVWWQMLIWVVLGVVVMLVMQRRRASAGAST